MFDLILKNGTLYDGTGREHFRGDVGITDSKIMTIDDLQSAPAERIIDVGGMAISPGFIDIHNHSEYTLLVDGRALSAIMQGVTTITSGNCGFSSAPISDMELAKWIVLGYSPRWGVEIDWRTYEDYLARLEDSHPAVNVFPFVGHGALRLAVMGPEHRPAADEEVERMKDLLRKCLNEGARGLSTGLEYNPGAAATLSELRQLVSEIGDGIYSTHTRSRNGPLLKEGVIEAIETVRGSKAHLQISHLAPRSEMELEGFTETLDLIQQATDEGISAGYDTMVLEWGPHILTDMIPAQMRQGSLEEIAASLKQPETHQLIQQNARSSLQYLLSADRSREMLLSCAPNHAEWVGKSFYQIAGETGRDTLDIALEIMVAEGVDLMTVCLRTPYTARAFLDKLMSDPYCVPMSDGAVVCADGPFEDFDLCRGSYGWAARFIQQAVREDKSLAMEEAIRRLTSLPASYLRLPDKGLLTRGADADIVVFDETNISDLSGEWGPASYAGGIAYVLVNGEVVVDRGTFTGSRAGQIL
jgi:N-acyl-D-aspartate/D-glutamate deacylase